MKIKLYDTTFNELGLNLVFRVMLPNGYDVLEDQKYPVLYLHDGQDFFYDEDSVSGESMRYASYYSQYSKFLPQVILVGIDCPMNNVLRTAQYTPYSRKFNNGNTEFESYIKGKGDTYLSWIVNELKPWIDQNFRTKPEPEFTGIGGYSTASIISLYALLKYPGVFSRLMTLSGAYYYWMNFLKEDISKNSLDNVKYIYMDTGTEEFGRITTKEQFLEGNKIMYKTLKDFGFDETELKFEIFSGEEHSPLSFRRRFPDAVRWIFQDM